MNKAIKAIHTEWSDSWGGQEMRILSEIIGLKEQGVKVFLACKKNSVLNKKAQENNIKTFTLRFGGNTDLITLYKLVKIIKKEQIDIVNTHSGKDTWVGGFAAKITGAKFIRTRHLSHRVNPSRTNFINELADFIFTTGEEVRKAMIQNNRIKPNQIMSIPSGIDETVFDPSLYNRQEQRAKIGIQEDDIAIGIIAFLRDYKRHDLFIKAADALLKKNKNLKFFIAGDGPLKQELKSLVEKLNLKEKVIFLGHTNQPATLLSALDIFVHTSDSNEGIPQSVMQALMMKKYVVATDAGSTRDLHHNDNFLLIKTHDLSAIINAVQDLIQNPNQLNIQRDFIVENFSRNTMIKKTLNIYKKLLS